MGTVGCGGLSVSLGELIDDVLRFTEEFQETVNLEPSDVIPSNSESFSQTVNVVVT